MESALTQAVAGRGWPLGAALVALVLAIASSARAVPTAGFVPPGPYLIGYGGDYPDGLAGELSSLGLPYERVFPEELSDPAALRRYRVLMLCCPVMAQAGFQETLLRWVTEGGRAYVEEWQSPALFTLSLVTAAQAPSPLDVLATAPQHPICSGLDPKAPIDLFHLYGVLINPANGGDAETLARFCPDGGGAPIAGGSAVLCFRLGAGEIICSGAPLAFARFHRGRSTEGLLLGIIRYLTQGEVPPRFVLPPLTVPDAAAAASSPVSSVPPAPAAVSPPSLPGGWQLVDDVTDGSYDVIAQVGGPAGSAPGASALLLDGRADRRGAVVDTGVWLTLDQDALRVCAGRSPESRPIAAAAWSPPAEPTELLVQRRPGAISVVSGTEELLRAEVAARAGGVVALRAGAVPLAEPWTQALGEPEFGDDFMREAGAPSPWTTVSGEWQNVGVGNEAYSVNGFYLKGQTAASALTTAGQWYWEDYTVGVAVRLEDGMTTCGLGALLQTNGDGILLLADSAACASPMLRLVQVAGGQETTLAQRQGGLTPQQWFRLGVRLRDGMVEGLLDGEEILGCANPVPRGGRIGLVVRGGAARFDDVLVQPSAEPLRSPRNEGSSLADPPPAPGPQDSLTWANPAMPWAADPTRPSVLWHQGAHFGDVDVALHLDPLDHAALRRLILAPAGDATDEHTWLAVTVELPAAGRDVRLSLAQPGRELIRKQVSLNFGREVRLCRVGGRTTVFWGPTAVCTAEGTGGLSRLGLEVEGVPIAPDDVRIASPEVHDYVFGVAPTDWWASAGTWEVAGRWACDPRWSWFAGWAEGDAVVWNKRLCTGDVVLDCTAGIKMEAPGGAETQRCRDLNTVLCGDRADPRSGYSFILGGDGGVKTQLLRRGMVVAENAAIRVPAGYGTHHQWHRIRAAKIGHLISLDFEGRAVFRYEDPEPLERGYVGLWTHDSGLLIPRVTIYTSPDTAR